MANYPKLSGKKEMIAEVIQKSRGNISVAAKMLGVSRNTIYRYIKDDNELSSMLDDERETMIDNVESKLYSEAINGNITAMIFFLKTQGKKRGYIDRQEFSGDITIKWDWEKPQQKVEIKKEEDESDMFLLEDTASGTD